ncbi:MAG: hypothetical protein RL088_2233 [Verrucomicrobiota bacterium]|jgi:hypothetical protein
MKIALVFLAPVAAFAAELPQPAAREVDFKKDIQPLLEAACVKCHAKGKEKGGFSFETRELFLKGGDSGKGAIVGKSAESLVVRLVASDDPDERMPKKGTHWTPEQIGLLRAWIDQGARWPEGVSFAKPQPHNLDPRVVETPAGEGNPIDRILAPYFASHAITPRESVTNAVFARRVWLDVIGLLPTAKELTEFENDPSPGKRAALVDRLLADSRGYAEHWLNFWNDLLRNDYRGTGFIDGGRKQVSGWLYNALKSNMPYDRFVRELTAPTTETEGFTSGILWRGNVNASMVPPMQAAQSVSQVFMGINLKCASCHDSFIDDWALADAYGLAAVYSDEALELVQCDKPLGKKAAVKFLYPGIGTIDAALSKPDRARRLAELLTSDKNGRLSRTLVNRLWARLLGRGLVEPVDNMDQPAWNSDLIDWLATDLVKNGWDVKKTLRVILTSKAYALPAVEGPKEGEKKFVFTGPLTRRFTAEQVSDALALLGAERPSLPSSMEFDFGIEGLSVPAWIWTSEPTEAGPRRDAMRAAHGQLDAATAKLSAARFAADPALALSTTTEALAAVNAAQAQFQKAAQVRATGAPGEIIARPDSDRHRVVFRKQIDLPAAPARARAFAAASQGMEIFVNGKEAKARMSDGFRNGRAKIFDIGSLLTAGKNIIAISVSSHTDKGMNSTERAQFPQSIHHENKTPGLAFYAHITLDGREPIQVISDGSWKSRRSPDGDWKFPALPVDSWSVTVPLPDGKAPVDEGPSLEPLKRRDFANIPVDLTPVIRPGVSTAAKSSAIRASMLAADPLQTALDRPNREVVMTTRPIAATTMQALELTNGATLDTALKQIAARQLPDATKDTAAWIAEIFRATLGRSAQPDEQQIAKEILGEKPDATHVADLVWMLVNHPEFQLIR